MVVEGQGSCLLSSPPSTVSHVCAVPNCKRRNSKDEAVRALDPPGVVNKDGKDYSGVQCSAHDSGRQCINRAHNACATSLGSVKVRGKRLGAWECTRENLKHVYGTGSVDDDYGAQQNQKRQDDPKYGTSSGTEDEYQRRKAEAVVEPTPASDDDDSSASHISPGPKLLALTDRARRASGSPAPTESRSEHGDDLSAKEHEEGDEVSSDDVTPRKDRKRKEVTDGRSEDEISRHSKRVK